jgi:hypothetical protein
VLVFREAHLVCHLIYKRELSNSFGLSICGKINLGGSIFADKEINVRLHRFYKSRLKLMIDLILAQRLITAGVFV